MILNLLYMLPMVLGLAVGQYIFRYFTDKNWDDALAISIIQSILFIIMYSIYLYKS